MRYLTVRGMKLDITAMQDFLRVYGSDVCESEKEREALVRDLTECAASSAHERKRYRVRQSKAPTRRRA